MDGVFFFSSILQAGASKASPPSLPSLASSPLHIPNPSHQPPHLSFCIRLFPFHLLFLTLSHASCVTQMGA